MYRPECPVDHVTTTELEPLSPESDRREVHKRLAAPLATIATISAIDDFRKLAPEADIGNLLRESLKNPPGGGHIGDYEAIHSALISPIRSLVINPMLNNAMQRFPDHFACKTYYKTNQQSLVLSNNLALPRMIEGFVSEGVNAQASTTFNIALPGYLIAKRNLSTSKEVADTVQTIGTKGVAAVLEESDFKRSLTRLTGTASGMYLRSNGSYTDDPRKYPLLDPKFTIQNNGDYVGEAVKASEQAPEAVTVYGLYTKGVGESVALSKEAIEALRYYLHFRNNILDSKQNLGGAPGPSIGCPVVSKSVAIREDDLTEQQWADALEGDNPIAAYDPASQRLTYRRQAIPEVNQLLVDSLRGNLA